MAQSKKRTTKKRKSKTTMMVSVFMLVFLSVVSACVFSQYKSYKQLELTKAEIEKCILDEQEKQAQLSTQKEYYGSDTYVEKTAREQLGLVKPDEIIFKNNSE